MVMHDIRIELCISKLELLSIWLRIAVNVIKYTYNVWERDWKQLTLSISDSINTSFPANASKRHGETFVTDTGVGAGPPDQ